MYVITDAPEQFVLRSRYGQQCHYCKSLTHISINSDPHSIFPQFSFVSPMVHKRQAKDVCTRLSKPVTPPSVSVVITQMVTDSWPVAKAASRLEKGDLQMFNRHITVP